MNRRIYEILVATTNPRKVREPQVIHEQKSKAAQ